MRQAQRDGLVSPDIEPADVYATVVALSMTWSPASLTTAAALEDSQAEHDRRRAALAAITDRAFRGAPTTSSNHVLSVKL
ncbi:hypothetical protein [Mycobacterium sp.]|uniref:hypothetical protein n=1 Tax=Mycobacterium sp. TaxID=1785 RepID=UPI003D0EF9AD